MRNELYNERLFFGLYSSSAIAEWADDYNNLWPHSSLGYQTSVDYAGIIAATAPFSVSKTVAAIIAAG